MSGLRGRTGLVMLGVMPTSKGESPPEEVLELMSLSFRVITVACSSLKQWFCLLERGVG